MGAYSRWVSSNPSASDKQIANVEFALKAIDASLSYTFVIDSDAALQAWANNTSGNDYSRILIKKGGQDGRDYWLLNTSSAIAIDISTGRTKSVIGESESKIVINNTGTDSIIGVKGILTGIFPNFTNPGNDYFFQNVTLDISGDFGSSGSSAFSNCSNLSNCTGSSSGGSAFSSCSNLSNCTGSSSSGSAFSNCSNLSNCTGSSSGSGGAFSNCSKLSNCTGTNTNTSGVNTHAFSNCNGLFGCIASVANTGGGAGGAYAVGFNGCRTGFGNRGTYVTTAGTYTSPSYMEQVTGNSVWANNANGGWNLSSAP